MPYFQISFPIVLYTAQVLIENKSILNSYLFRLLSAFGIKDPMRLLTSIVIQTFMGIEYQDHYRDLYPQIKQQYSPYFKTYCPDVILSFINSITSFMITWKILLFQIRLVKTRCPELLSSKFGKILDLDGYTIKSSSSKKEGAEIGFNKKAKGKPCFQLAASFFGRIFVDIKLYAGHCNPSVFFRKAVKRAKAPGLPVEIVRADSAYLTLENLLCLAMLSLGYAVGASARFSVVKLGIESFKKLARQGSPAIISTSTKGVSVLDLGWVNISDGMQTRIIIVRRISRRKNRKTGRWKIKTYYYAIASNLDMTPAKLYAFYHKRQCIEAGFRELKNHYYVDRLPFKNLKANEFWIACKILAMTLFKIFQVETLPKAKQTLLLKTFIRRILQKNLRFTPDDQKVEILPKAANRWLLQRLLSKIERIKIAINA